jgi:hypothetical protein
VNALTDTLIQEIKTAPEEGQREVLDFLSFLKARQAGGREGIESSAACPHRLGRRLEYR